MLSKIRVVHKSIAYVFPAIHQTQKENLKKFHKDKKNKSLDLQPRKIHTVRHQRNKREENLKTKKQRKVRLHPPCKYAVKAGAPLRQ